MFNVHRAATDDVLSTKIPVTMCRTEIRRDRKLSDYELGDGTIVSRHDDDWTPFQTLLRNHVFITVALISRNAVHVRLVYSKHRDNVERTWTSIRDNNNTLIVCVRHPFVFSALPIKFLSINRKCKNIGFAFPWKIVFSVRNVFMFFHRRFLSLPRENRYF